MLTLLSVLTSAAPATDLVSRPCTAYGHTTTHEPQQHHDIVVTAFSPAGTANSPVVDPTPKRLFLRDPHLIATLRAAMRGQTEDPHPVGEELYPWPVRHTSDGALLLVGGIQSRDGAWKLGSGRPSYRVDGADLSSTLR